MIGVWIRHTDFTPALGRFFVSETQSRALGIGVWSSLLLGGWNLEFSGTDDLRSSLVNPSTNEVPVPIPELLAWEVAIFRHHHSAMSFKNLPTQSQSIQLLQRSLERGRLAHAY